MGDGWPDCPVWTWSVGVYGRDGVAAACLELQDRHGLDVNLLLLACWLAAHGRALDGETLARARAATGRWQAEVVRPLRAARRALKAQLAAPAPGEIAHGGERGALAAGLRRRLAALELDAEHLEQLGLAAAAAAVIGRAAGDAAQRAGPALAAANLARCHRFGAADREALRALLAGVFDAMPAAEIEAALLSSTTGV